METFSILVAGSKGDHVVSRTADGRWHCDCAAMRFGRGVYCRHILSMHRPDEVGPLRRAAAEARSA